MTLSGFVALLFIFFIAGFAAYAFRSRQDESNKRGDDGKRFY